MEKMKLPVFRQRLFEEFEFICIWFPADCTYGTFQIEGKSVITNTCGVCGDIENMSAQ